MVLIFIIAVSIGLAAVLFLTRRCSSKHFDAQRGQYTDCQFISGH